MMMVMKCILTELIPSVNTQPQVSVDTFIALKMTVKRGTEECRGSFSLVVVKSEHSDPNKTI